MHKSTEHNFITNFPKSPPPSLNFPPNLVLLWFAIGFRILGYCIYYYPVYKSTGFLGFVHFVGLGQKVWLRRFDWVRVWDLGF